jgi:hypothetical protein
MVVVAGEAGDLDEAEALVETAVPLGGGTAQVAAGGAEAGGAAAEQLDQVTADAGVAVALDHQQVVEAGHAGDHLTQRDAHQLTPGAGLDHHRVAGPVAVLTEDALVGRRPLARQEPADLAGLLVGDVIGDLVGALSQQL